MDLFLAQLFGLYFIIIGVAVLVRKKSVMPTYREMLANKPVLFAVALLEIAAGLAIVLANPVITLDWVGLISLIGWMLLVEGVLYLTLPSKVVQKFAKYFGSAGWMTAGALVAIVAGGYLAFIGFGLGPLN